jgi:hypothetical protein
MSDEDKDFVIDGMEVAKLRRVMTRLYNSDDKPLKPGEARDLANAMHGVLGGLAEVSLSVLDDLKEKFP